MISNERNALTGGKCVLSLSYWYTTQWLSLAAWLQGRIGQGSPPWRMARTPAARAGAPIPTARLQAAV